MIFCIIKLKYRSKYVLIVSGCVADKMKVVISDLYCISTAQAYNAVNNKITRFIFMFCNVS